MNTNESRYEIVITRSVKRAGVLKGDGTQSYLNRVSFEDACADAAERVARVQREFGWCAEYVVTVTDAR
jgi:hypothetical protein